MWVYIKDGIVTDLARVDPFNIFAPEYAAQFIEAPADVTHGWTYSGGQFSPPVPEPVDMLAAVTQAAQERLDAFARTKTYDSMLSACTYATSTVARLKAEGLYCVSARDATWEALHQYMGEVQAGTKPVPTTVDEVLAILPVLAWPS